MSGIKGANAGEKCARYVHGETKTRLHKIWESMIARCEYEKHPYYADYGGRGITVCDEWHNYIEFRDWAITHGYNDDLTIDRIKNEKGYYASNCRWTTMREQQNNKRSNHIVYLGEIGHTISEWSEILGIGKTTIRMRLESGWSDEDALTVPVRKEREGIDRQLHAEQRWMVDHMADETGIVLPWEKDAMAGLEMPNGLSYPDQILYLELRMLYHQYYQKVIDRETATKEKKKMLDEYRVNQFREELGRQWVEVTRLTELARADYRKNPCHENAVKLIEIIEGRNL